MKYPSERKRQHHFSVSHLYCKTVQPRVMPFSRNKKHLIDTVIFFCPLREEKFITDEWEEALYQLSGLFPSQLFVQPGDVGVPLGLVACPCHRCSQFILPPEVLDLELCTAVPRAVGQGGLRAGQGTRLLIDQPHVPMKTLEKGEWQGLNYWTGKLAHI